MKARAFFRTLCKNSIWGIAISAVAVLLVLIASCNRTTTISLNDYVTVDFEGLNGRGVAEATIDTDAMEDAIAQKIRFTGTDDERASLSSGDSSDVALFVKSCVSGELEPSEDLSNGDVVTWKWDVNEENAKQYFNAVLETEDLDFTVEGLEEKDTDGMIFPDSDTTRLKAADLEDMDIDDLKMALYEIYARHGYIFHNEDTQKQFEKYNWYEPTIDPDDWNAEDELSKIELANEKLLKDAIKAAKAA